MAKKIINTSSIMKKFLILSIAFVFLWVGQFFVRTLSNKMPGESNLSDNIKISEALSCVSTQSVNTTERNVINHVNNGSGYYDGSAYHGCR